MKNTRKARKAQKSKKASRNRGGLAHGGLSTTVYSPARALPTSMCITAVFSEQGYLGNAVRQWTPNSFYDCQPAVGGNKWNEYDQWSELYTSYRVLSYKYKFEFANTENGLLNPAHIYILQTDANPGTTLTNYQELSGQQHCRSLEIGTDRRVVYGGSSIAQFAGERAPDYTDSFKAVMNSDPQDKIWLSLGIEYPQALGVSGIQFRLVITAKIRLFAPNIDINTIRMMRPTLLEREAARLVYKERKWASLQKENSAKAAEQDRMKMQLQIALAKAVEQARLQ